MSDVDIHNKTCEVQLKRKEGDDFKQEPQEPKQDSDQCTLEATVAELEHGPTEGAVAKISDVVDSVLALSDVK